VKSPPPSSTASIPVIPGLPRKGGARFAHFSSFCGGLWSKVEVNLKFWPDR
jgi:hypothetical protein